MRLALGWQTLHYAVPIFWLYALLFADTGLSVAEISALFAIWSSVGIVAEVPTGALADRWSRRGSVAASGVVIGAGFAVWVLAPGFAGFAAGFVLWGIGGALASGALEALLYDGLAAYGAVDSYPRVAATLDSLAHLAQIPAGLAASALYEVGGFALVGWVSVGCALASTVPALLLPSPPPSAEDGVDDEPGWAATMADGVRQAVRARGVASAVLAVAVLGGVDAVEEYFPLLAADAGVPIAVVPLALLAVPLAGALGSAAGGTVARSRLAAPLLLVGAVAGLGAAALTTHPAGLAGVIVFWGLYQAVRVCTEVRLQDRIRGRTRATVTSVAAFGTEFSGIALFGAYAWGGAGVVALLVLACVPLVWSRPVRVGAGELS